ncbi:unnamed protein product [Pelagomonas calceolata]|uniref:EF-hand domain-containing protein n=3 Tax=Pelagomonas calceolata TaxID=35677 RepID=A0A8J2SI59_9STRA|nr:unnamed protein product [Pelagomonas calceolata]
MPQPDPKALHAALQKYAEASIQKETACLTQELGLQYQVLHLGNRVQDRLIRRSRKAVRMMDNGKSIDDLPDGGWEPPVDTTLRKSSRMRRSQRIPGVTLDDGSSFRENMKRLEKGWRGSPGCKAQNLLTFSLSANKLVNRDRIMYCGGDATIPGLVGTPASQEHQNDRKAKVAGGRDFSLTEFIHCVRTGKGGMGMLNAGLPNGQKLSDLSDKKLAKIFQEIDEDQSNSLSFDEFIHAVEVWEIGRTAARDRRRKAREEVCWRGGISKQKFVQRVRDAGRIGGFGQVLARGRKLRDHSTRELRALFDVIDDDGNGSLTAKEFIDGLEALDDERPASPKKRPGALAAAVASAPAAATASTAASSTAATA